ncbi:RagB/SusD family nutrient uptake outer membrane protein [Sphingobacterium paucimobilis]|uniref:Starch-binding protein n=1 Tax=Sphingobacterium paucimobilis HER1398 TaxID=1346330 RepID=U2HHA2_9SPHI|nr:RagB/SusD family nutrient uptake outer membrane protein [Sphingobacterium paucimobilis]ERJ61126.1 hypothetical protein M472_20455 [Sphingobacterium paucimobilis HER1398]
MKFTRFFIYTVLVLGGMSSCNKLDQEPKSTVSKEAVFNTESGLKLYSNSFYSILPTATDILRGDNMGDFVARKDVPDFFRPGAFGPRQSTGWTWTALRNINYFLENNNSPGVGEEVRNNYNGIARLFRALFYFEKVKRFGNVPWINKTLSNTDQLLYGGRDSRALVMDSVLKDLDFAIQHISAVSEPTRTRITKSAALALKSRICLFEGTYRKYHEELKLQSTADEWLREAAGAASAVMDSKLYSLHNSGEETSYRDLFVKQGVTNETILNIAYSTELGVYHDANWYYTSASYGDRLSFTRKFIHTYLNRDGSSFTASTDYRTKTFQEETQHRDRRLQQTIRTEGYARVNGGKSVLTAPSFSHTYTGYQPIKWVEPDESLDGGARNAYHIPLIRYAEVLLNFAEAKAELGDLSDADWAKSIGLLRERGGITQGLTSKPVIVDAYLKEAYFPGINDAVILEVRRERGIELALEGFRFYDIIRWKRGELFTDEWNGMYVPTLNTPMDLNGDGKNDVAFVTATPSQTESGVIYMNIAGTVNGQPNAMILSEGNKGEILWMNHVPRVWHDRMYLYPIPESDYLMNPNLKQNPNW